MIRAVLLAVVSVLCVVRLNAEGDSCYSFAGGSVYPHHYARGGDHDLLSTKAVSEYSSHIRPSIELTHIYFIPHSLSSCAGFRGNRRS